MNAPLLTIPSKLSPFLKYSRAIGFKGLPALGGAEGRQPFEPRTNIAVVKKTFHYWKVFFYNHSYHPSVFRYVFLKSGINLFSVDRIAAKS